MKNTPLWLGLLLVGAALGCGKPSYDRYVPAEPTARRALETALDHWKGGGKPGKLTGPSATVEVLDSRWGAGQKLAGYEIVNEESGEGGRWFTVRLTLQKPGGVQSARYVVVGKDPLWVYRDEDFKKVTGM
jgi:hypothetical protein